MDIDWRAATEWLLSGASGRSSETILRRLAGIPLADRHWNWPLDDSDFARCYVLLKQIPSLRPRIGEMADVNREWAALVAHWDELERIFVQTPPTKYYRIPALTQRLQEILEAVA